MNTKAPAPSHIADRFMLRLPEGWRAAIKARAARNRRSMNQEILAALEAICAPPESAGNAPFKSFPADTKAIS